VQPIRAVQWSPAGDALRIIDQRRLPAECVERDLRTLPEVHDAIVTLAVRGAPAIGVAAAIGLVATLLPYANGERNGFDALLDAHARALRAARPTAVNLGWAIDRMTACATATRGSPAKVLEAMRAEATKILDEDRAMCEAIGRNAAEFVRDGTRVLTHCNTGALATAGIGTALAAVYVAHAAGKRVRVYADETRPLLQGSRLTAWELQRAGIPVTLIADGMAAALMARGEVDVVLVGADRIAANGDVANKVGTYGLAVAAKHHGVPFVVCAPTSTIDAATATGAAIEVEQRGAQELRALQGEPTAPADADVWNPAFDVTPAALVTAIVTDRGVFRPPYRFQR
jgi:methylthioribose-1-phosphate isomerase